MKADPTQTSLVITGSWNQAIFQPKWVGERLLDATELECTASLLLTAGMKLDFQLGSFVFSSQPGRVDIRPCSNEPVDLSRTEATADRLLELLPETPITAFGVNFHFTGQTPEPFLERLFALVDVEKLAKFGTTSETTISRMLQMDSHRLRLTIARHANDFTLGMNHHHQSQVGSARDARPLIRGSVAKAWELSQQIISEVYDS